MNTKHTNMTYADGILWVNPDARGDRAVMTEVKAGYLTETETDILGEFIATTCNAHADLVAALENLVFDYIALQKLDGHKELAISRSTKEARATLAKVNA